MIISNEAISNYPLSKLNNIIITKTSIIDNKAVIPNNLNTIPVYFLISIIDSTFLIKNYAYINVKIGINIYIKYSIAIPI